MELKRPPSMATYMRKAMIRAEVLIQILMGGSLNAPPKRFWESRQPIFKQILKIILRFYNLYSLWKISFTLW